MIFRLNKSEDIMVCTKKTRLHLFNRYEMIHVLTCNMLTINKTRYVITRVKIKYLESDELHAEH